MKKKRAYFIKTSSVTPKLRWVWCEECDQLWATTPKSSDLHQTQDRGEVPHTSTNIGLDQYQTSDLNLEIFTSLMHIT